MFLSLLYLQIGSLHLIHAFSYEFWPSFSVIWSFQFSSSCLRMPEIQLGAHTLRSHGLKVARSHMHDWLILILLVVVEVILNVIEPFHRFVGKEMLTDLSYPLKGNTIPFWGVPVSVTLTRTIRRKILIFVEIANITLMTTIVKNSIIHLLFCLLFNFFATVNSNIVTNGCDSCLLYHQTRCLWFTPCCIGYLFSLLGFYFWCYCFLVVNW